MPSVSHGTITVHFSNDCLHCDMSTVNKIIQLTFFFQFRFIQVQVILDDFYNFNNYNF